MTPSAWRDGGRGETIRFVIADSALGSLLIAATAKGICRLTFDEDETALARRFPNADIHPDDGTISAWVEAAIDAVGRPGAAADLPLDVRGTAFQEAVWRELRRIPPVRRAAMPPSPPPLASRELPAPWEPQMGPIRLRSWCHATA